MSTSLRYNEYYGMQNTFDWLYDRSRKRATNGLRLYELIISRENILLAYRNIKANTGSKTKGTDGLTITDYKIKNERDFIDEIKNTLQNYKPSSIRRIEIPKDNGKTRPLGIPTMRDRLIQQMFKQILEPICEARFFNHSYGFRPNRRTHHAMARCQFLINHSKLHHVVDIDIMGFFDNINHAKLLKQMYDIGIKDRRVLSIVSKMLKAPIKGVGIPTKGTPQGGILSPLLSNIVLNELDWWIGKQWENFETRHRYAKLNKYVALKKTNLKEIFIVRYADDFKVFTRSHKTAEKTFHAIKSFLKENLKLDISTEKSQITNLRKKSSNFLEFKIRAVRKRRSYVANTHIADKKKSNIVLKLKELAKKIRNCPNAKSVNQYNLYVIGIKNYYQFATHISINASEIAYRISKNLYNRLKSIGKYEIPRNPNKTYKSFNKNRYRTFKVDELYLHVIADVKTINVVNFNQHVCNYTPEGRSLIYKNLKPLLEIEVTKLMKNAYKNNTVELADNKLSVYSAQKGMCPVLKKFLYADEVEIHHKKPKALGGSDEYRNLVALHKDIHMLIRLTKQETIEKYMDHLQLNAQQLEMVNKYREKCNLASLV